MVVNRTFEWFGLAVVSVSCLTFFLPPCSAAVDEYMSCDRFFESKRTARYLEEIPCDMTKQGYCAHKGSAYPESQIWNFKEDNRALMKRLYGEMDPTMLYREMRAVNLPSASNIPSLEHHVFSSLEYNIRVGSGLATVASAREPVVGQEETTPHELPKQKNKKVIVKRRKKKPVQAKPKGNKPVMTSAELPQAKTGDVKLPIMPESRLKIKASNIEAEEEPTEAANGGLDMNLDASGPTDNVAKPSTSNLDNTSPSLSDILSEVNLESLEQIVGELLPSVGESQPANDREQSEFPNAPQVLESGSQVVMAQAAPQTSQDSFLFETDLEPQTEDESQFGGADPSNVEVDESFDYATDEEVDEEDNEIEDEIQYTGKAVNACPVKEEVFAPYWANNTRNQVLALLNLYPFEQYIHMETCKFEEEQMLCRRGCRCEQQYRLHRLLAFDPNNECRGIFSDWFRFPSYCICKCYNFPEEYVANPPKSSKRKKRVNEGRQGSNSKMYDVQGRRNFRSFEMNPPAAGVEITEPSTEYVLPELRSKDIASNAVEHSARGIPAPTEEKFFYAGAPISEYATGLESGQDPDSQTPR